MEKNWLVAKLSKFPRLASFLKRRLGRTSAGGLFLTVGLALVLALAVLTGALYDMVNQAIGLARYDRAVAEFGRENAGAAAQEVARLFTRLGGTMVISLVAAAVAGWGWWRYRKPQVALFMLVVVGGQAIINNGLKLLVSRDRPDIAQLAPFSGSSFPSGHSAAAIATYMAVALVITLRRGFLARTGAMAGAVFLSAGVAATRALLGVHWLTDVIAGLAVGLAWFIVCAVVFGGSMMRFGEPLEEVPRTGSGN